MARDRQQNRQRGRSRDQGKVVEVGIVPVGDETIQFHAANSTVLTLNDTSDFDEAGGRISVAGVVYIYLSRDDDLQTLTLAAPGLTADVSDEEPVLLYPLSNEKWAGVVLEEEDDIIYARIPQSMANDVMDGIREDDEQESAVVELDGTEWTVIDMVGPSEDTFSAGGGGGATILDELDDVTAPLGTAANRQHLSYDSATAQWKAYGPVVKHGTALPSVPADHAWTFFVKHI